MNMILVNSDPKISKTLLRRVPLSSLYTVAKKVRLRTQSNKERHWTKPHPGVWTPEHHWPTRFCGQSCPCCRANAGDVAGVCPFCCAWGRFLVEVGTEVVVLEEGADIDGFPMKKVEYARRGLGEDCVHSGWVYSRNLKNTVFTADVAVPNGTCIEIVRRGDDEKSIGMYEIKTAMGTRGWVYGKNVRDPGGDCAICLETLNCDLRTLFCSHQFHARCIQELCKTSTSCPVCRSPIASFQRSGT